MLETVPKIDLVYMLGFFMALALRRGRVDNLVGGMLKFFPTENNPGLGVRNDEKGSDE